jgi:EpsI family protein
MIVAALALQARSQAEILPSRDSLSALPKNLSGWKGEDYSIEPETLEILGPGEFLAREYEPVDGARPPVDLFIAYYPSQRASETPHSPDHCLPGSGWVPTMRQLVNLPGPNGSFPANRYVVSKAGDRQLVLYWFQAHGRAVASGYLAKYYLASDSIRMNRSDGALVRLITPMYPKESPESAQARLWDFGAQVVPMLDRYIPR